jgi:hypothetical protein
VVQAGVLASDGQHRFFPDLAVNDCNDMVVGYTKSSASTFPGTSVAGRRSSDPPGTLQPEVQLRAGEIAYTAFDNSPFRWGDYTGMTIDPNGKTFWYAGQYSKITGNQYGRWAIYIGSFEFDTCTPRLLDNQLFLPVISNSNQTAPPPPPPPPSKPAAGYWRAPIEEFYVTPDQNTVNKFTTHINVTGCGNYTIVRNALVPIDNNAFSFSGSFFASGTFHDTVNATGNMGLNNFFIAGCGYVSGGPFPWNAVWMNGSQPAATVATDDETVVELLPGSISGPFRVTRLHE